MFTPRFTVPEYGNKYYNRIKSGGYNPCIVGNYPYNSKKPVGFAGMDVLPNCTGYATGRFAEIIGEKKCQYLGKGNARDYITYAIKQGLEVGTQPKVGACAVWDDGKFGHVAIVEQVTNDETIIVSQSGWDSKIPFWIATHRKGNGNWIEGNDYSWMKNYKFTGFIYNPEGDMTKAETEKLIRELVPQIIAEMKKETEKLPADDWAKDAINMAIARGIMVGYPDGFHPQSEIRREEVAQVIANLTAKE